MKRQVLRVVTSRYERRKDRSVLAYEFIFGGGTFSMTEVWASADEFYSASMTVCPSARIWRLAWPWILKHARPTTPRNRVK